MPEYMTINGAFALLIALALVYVAFYIFVRSTGPKFSKRSLMNKSEARLYSFLTMALPDDWVVMCQVSYGAFLSNKSYKRYMTVNSKRADFVVVDPQGIVLGVVEYQGSGHFGSSKQSARVAKNSDQIKRRALLEARIPLLEVPPKIVKSHVQSFLDEIQRDLLHDAVAR